MIKEIKFQIKIIPDQLKLSSSNTEDWPNLEELDKNYKVVSNPEACIWK